MIRSLEGTLAASGLRFAVLATRFNELVTESLLRGAVDCLRRHGVAESEITIVRVPGSFELPLAAQVLAEQGEHDAIVCLGALVRGDTSHFDVLAAQVTTALGRVMLDRGVPVTCGVLTCESVEQALNRAGAKSGNKGWDAALAAIEMATLMRDLKASRSPARRV